MPTSVWQSKKEERGKEEKKKRGKEKKKKRGKRVVTAEEEKIVR